MTLAVWAGKQQGIVWADGLLGLYWSDFGFKVALV